MWLIGLKSTNQLTVPNKPYVASVDAKHHEMKCFKLSQSNILRLSMLVFFFFSSILYIYFF